MVEFSIMMIVMIPLLTYAFYILDLGHHMLDLQETVISTTWDYTSATYEGDPDKTNLTTNLANIFHANRLEYIDHTSAYDDFSDLHSSSDEKKYHFELGSRAAWVTSGSSGRGSSDAMAQQSEFKSDYSKDDASQVVCARDETGDLGWLVGGTINPAYGFGKKYGRGGVVTCWARLQVYNYVIPEKFMQEHAHEDVTKSKLEARSQDVESLSSAAKPVTLHDHAALSFGTWAINNGDTNITSRSSKSTSSDGDIDYCPKAKNPFYQRVAWVYSGGLLAGGSNALTGTYLAAEGAMVAFAGEALSNELEIVAPIPVKAGSTDGSPEGADCGFGADAETMVGRPANPAGVNLVARHDRDNMQTGVLQKRSFSMDFLALEPGYESTPYKNGNNKYEQAWKKRGQFYMGATSDTP